MVQYFVLLFMFVAAFICKAEQASLEDYSRSFEKQVEDQSKKALKLKWRYGVYGVSSSEFKDEAHVGVMSLRTELNYEVSSYLSFFSDFKLQIKSGQIQQRFHSYDLKHSFHAYGFGLRFKPFRFIEIDAGSINQSFLKTELLIDSYWSFLGIKENIQVYKGDYWGLSLKMQQSLPSYNIQNNYRLDKELGAFLLTNTAELRLDWKAIDFASYLSFYRFSNLPSYVAYESGLLGNSIKGNTTSSRFKNEFYGYVLGFDGKINFGPDLVGFFQAYHITNYASEYQGADAHWIGGRVIYTNSDQMGIGCGLSYFFNESDVGPAFYNSSHYGNSNREGRVFSFYLTSKKYRMNLKAEYVNAQTLRANTYQKNLNHFAFRAEVINESF